MTLQESDDCALCDRPSRVWDHVAIPGSQRIGPLVDGPIRGRLCYHHNKLATDIVDLRAVIAYVEAGPKPDAPLYSDVVAERIKEGKRRWDRNNPDKVRAARLHYLNAKRKPCSRCGGVKPYGAKHLCHECKLAT